MIPVKSDSTIANYNRTVNAVNRDRRKYRTQLDALYEEQKQAADRFEKTVDEVEARIQVNHRNAEKLKYATDQFARLTGVSSGV